MIYIDMIYNNCLIFRKSCLVGYVNDMWFLRIGIEYCIIFVKCMVMLGFYVN